jgi:hypothetical protein
MRIRSFGPLRDRVRKSLQVEAEQVAALLGASALELDLVAG